MLRASTRFRSLYMAAYDAQRVQFFLPSEVSVSVKSRASWSGNRRSAPLGFGAVRDWQPAIAATANTARMCRTMHRITPSRSPANWGRIASPDPRARTEAVVQVNDAPRLSASVDDHEGSDGATRVLLHRPRCRRHDPRDRLPQLRGALEEDPLKIPVRENPAQDSVAVHDRRQSKALVQDLDERLVQRRFTAHHRKSAPAMHEIRDAKQGGLTEHASGVEEYEILARKALHAKEHDCERIPQGERGRGRRRGYEILGTGLPHPPEIQDAVRAARERGAGIARDRHDRNPAAPEGREEPQELRRLAALGKEDGRVPGGDNAQVPMDRVDRMNKTRGGAGAGERGGDLLRDEPGLADT